MFMDKYFDIMLSHMTIIYDLFMFQMTEIKIYILKNIRI
ncbi:hypothetical protein B0I63_004972 [Clostridium beijerinckii]|uniref:Uncharacterized protein n=1 Tax=Clostridium beijerinckii TaxID=1520 RepID=A0A9Q5GPH1_CLOBE|nr:hypothetical protein CLBIJ_47620 [Clostridium beijerinckii]MBA2884627.1 hypothetical protein [Clostridium beijerinckii]MBA2909854.1 hypothetical protein [Clostridium beijerinckii]MBA9013056.1 hypothetical protein [Clostridium beijerinckii]NRS98801.1 hypothetical protein [Clostridium beijerinckii]